jgi:hypothetical protein
VRFNENTLLTLQNLLSHWPVVGRLWLLINVPTDNLNAFHAVFAVPWGKVKGKVVLGKDIELLKLGTFLLIFFCRK